MPGKTKIPLSTRIHVIAAAVGHCLEMISCVRLSLPPADGDASLAVAMYFLRVSGLLE